MKCRLPGAFFPFEQFYITWWPHHSRGEAFLPGKSGPAVIALWSGKAMTLCVLWEMYTGFLADFPCEQKQKSTKRTRKLDPWPTKGKTEPEICVCEQVILRKWKETWLHYLLAVWLQVNSWIIFIFLTCKIGMETIASHEAIVWTS